MKRPAPLKLMRVRITKAFASSKGSHNAGEELDVPDDRGVELLKLGVAVKIERTPEKAIKDRNVRVERATR